MQLKHQRRNNNCLTIKITIMDKNIEKLTTKDIPSTTNTPPPPRREEREIPRTVQTPPPSKSGSNGKK